MLIRRIEMSRNPPRRYARDYATRGIRLGVRTMLIGRIEPRAA